MQSPLHEMLHKINLKNLNLDNYSDVSPIGSLVGVGLDYPDEMYDLHNDYILAAEKWIALEMLSKYQL